jgi:GNAT superfamily N-acetyltransferase
MLLRIDSFEGIDRRKLMDVYAESNRENAGYFFPDADLREGIARVEEGFLRFLDEEFFAADGSTYWVLSENGEWVSALRTSRISDGLYYIEALETAPEHRRKGHGAKLLKEVIRTLGEDGPFRICDCVSKRNTASVNTHLAAGFSIAAEEGHDLLRNETDPDDLSFEYIYDREKFNGEQNGHG